MAFMVAYLNMASYKNIARISPTNQKSQQKKGTQELKQKKKKNNNKK